MKYEESVFKLHSWLCRCYGPNHISENDFNYWVNSFFNIKESKTKILDTFLKSSLIEKTEKGLVTKKCDDSNNQTN
jgi:hypothetical protein